jgi:hypothetical protein
MPDSNNGKHDLWTHRMIVGSITGVAFAGVLGVIYLAAIGRPAPGELIAIASGAAGALAGALTDFMKRGDD